MLSLGFELSQLNHEKLSHEVIKKIVTDGKNNGMRMSFQNLSLSCTELSNQPTQ